jgi:CMP-N-acetylneuraminic acid synthetase
MIGGKRVVAVVTARSGSKGLPGKNIRPLCGKPLVAWSIEQGLACRVVDTVVVSTDSDEIAEVARRAGARVPFLRPSTLAEDTSSSVDVLVHALDHLETLGEHYEYIVLLEPTSPLREVSDIVGAIERLHGSDAESVVGVARAESSHPAFLMRLEGGRLRPMGGIPPTALRRQDLAEEFFYLEGSIYASRVASLRARRSFYHERTAPWVVDRYKAVEIDELSDFVVAEALMNARLSGTLG